MQKNAAWIGWVIGLLVVVGLVWWMYDNRAPSSGVTATSTPITVADPSSLPGLLTGNAPWSANHTNLAARLAADSLPALTAEGSVLHIHQHLDLFINGQRVTVPAEIGVDEPSFISPIHVHDATAIIHVESPYVANFTLGQFFDVWGVKFTATTIGGYAADATHTLRVYVNGTLYSGDPRQLVLASHQEIAIVYGTESTQPVTIPSSYTFPAGY